MYMCRDCGASFEEPNVWYDDPSAEGVSLVKGAYEYQECPNCGSDDIVEANICEKCGSAFLGEGHLCKYCKADFATSLREVQSLYGLDEDLFAEQVAEHFGW